MDIFFIRHAQSTWNRDGRVQGHRNPPLAPEGRESARRLARFLHDRFGPFPKMSTRIVSSPLKRALETAGFIGKKLSLPVCGRPNLKELGLGEWEGRAVADIRIQDPAKLNQWYRDPTRLKLKGGEPLTAFRDRVRTEIQRLLYIYGEADRLIVVTHGGWISTLMTDVVRTPMGRMWTFVLDNCSVTRMLWDGKKLYLRSFNETAAPLPGSQQEQRRFGFGRRCV